LASKAWRALSLLTMAVLALLVYEGFGAVMVISVAAMWQWQSHRGRRSHAAHAARPVIDRYLFFRLSLMAGLAALLWWIVPWPGGASAPGTVENVDRYVVRAPCAAHVRALLVENAQQVAAGQEIAHLESDELTLELAELELELAQGEVKLRSQRTKKQLVEWQVEERRQQALAERIADCRRKLDELTVRAPAAGRIVARRLADLPDSYLAEGAEICSVVSDDLEFRILVAQRDVPVYAAHLGREISVILPGRNTKGVLTSLEPQASAALADSNLGAHAGGPLAVAPAEANSGRGDDSASPWKFTEPRVIGHVRLVDHELLAGQRGTVRVRPANYTVGRRLATAVSGWWDKLNHQSQQRTSMN
jgi:hypothetical protein